MLLGWDTDEFPTNVLTQRWHYTKYWKMAVSHQAGSILTPKSVVHLFEMEDLLLAHIAGMDTYARALKAAAKIKEDRFLDELKEKR